MGRSLGQSSIIFKDSVVLDLEKEFPREFTTVGLSMSGGVESTALLLLLIQVYGKENVHVFTGFISGRRQWESENTFKLAQEAGLSPHQIHVVDRKYEVMSPKESYDLMIQAKKIVSLDGWFNGINRLLFAQTRTKSAEEIKRINKLGIFLPFIRLYKQHTIEIFFLLDQVDLLYKTFSCTVQKHVHCGNCYCCWERVRGFATIDQKDHAIYGKTWREMLDVCYYSDLLIVDPKEET